MPSSTPIIRPAVREDLPALVRIYNHVVENDVATFDLEPTTLEARERWFDAFGEDDFLLAAEVDEEPRAFAWYLPYRTKPAYAATKEIAVYVDPQNQARGLGTALYERLVYEAVSGGVHTLIAVIALPGPASVALHEKFGFREVGRLSAVGRKFERWIDTALYQKILRKEEPRCPRPTPAT